MRTLVMRILVEKYGGEATPETLAAAALLVVRAGGRVEPGSSLAEVEALAEAAEVIAKERALLQVMCLRRPADAAADWDGGEAQRAELLADFRAVCAERGA